MNFIDIIILVLFVWFVFKGYKNGLIKELTGIISIALGIGLAFRFSGLVCSIIDDFDFAAKEYTPLIAFLVIFISVIIATYFLSQLVSGFIKMIKMNWLNRLAGLVFGGIKIILIIGVVIMLINSFWHIIYDTKPEYLNNSVLYEPMVGFIEYLYPYIEEHLPSFRGTYKLQ